MKTMTRKVSRRKFMATAFFLSAGMQLRAARSNNRQEKKESTVVMTVSGPLDTERMGMTLTHEHILVDFIGADKVDKSRYNAAEVYEVAFPYVKDVRAAGTSTFIDCTPAYIGRDVKLLQKISEGAGINILTTTGYYGAAREKFVPAHAYNESAQQLADRWIVESRDGIEGTAIRPGLIKTGTDKGPLTKMQRKLIEAAGIAHLATGLTIAVHSGDGRAAVEQLEILQALRVAPSARIWVHAQNETNPQMHIDAARRNTWVSFDGVNTETLQATLENLKVMKANKLLDRVLVSQDSGWYHVGEPGGGTFNPYTCIARQFIPLLRQHDFTAEDIDQLFKVNPAKAFAIGVRRL